MYEERGAEINGDPRSCYFSLIEDPEAELSPIPQAVGRL